VKAALGVRSSAASKVGRAASRRPATVAELVRVKLRVTEQADARIRRGLLRIAAGQVPFSSRFVEMYLPFICFRLFFRWLLHCRWAAHLYKISDLGLGSLLPSNGV
jgi:hypothetical protein